MKRFFAVLIEAPDSLTTQEVTDQLDLMAVSQGTGIEIDGLYVFEAAAREEVEEALMAYASEPTDKAVAAVVVAPTAVFLN